MRLTNKLVFFVFLIVNVTFFSINIIWVKDNFASFYDSVNWQNINGLVSVLEKLYAPKGIINLLYSSYGHGAFYTAVYFLYQTTIAFLLGFLSNVSVVFGNCVLFTVTGLFVYKIGELLKGRHVGLLAVILLSIFPGIYGITRYCMVDNISIPLVSLTILLLLKSDYFANRRESIFLGIVLGLGIWAKAFYVYFVMGGLIYEFIRLLIAIKRKYVKYNAFISLKNIIIIIVLASLIGLPHYCIHLSEIISFPTDRFTGSSLFMYRGFNADAVLFYPYVLINNHLSLPLALIFLFCAAYLLKTKRITHRNKLHLYIWILVPYFLYSLDPTKFSRYTKPCLPAVALITSLGINIVLERRKILKHLLIVLIIIFGVTQNILFSFFNVARLEQISMKIPLYKPRKQGHYEVSDRIYLFQSNPEILPPDQKDKKIVLTQIYALLDKFLKKTNIQNIYCIRDCEVGIIDDINDSDFHRFRTYLGARYVFKGHKVRWFNFCDLPNFDSNKELFTDSPSVLFISTKLKPEGDLSEFYHTFFAKYRIDDYKWLNFLNKFVPYIVYKLDNASYIVLFKNFS